MSGFKAVTVALVVFLSACGVDNDGSPPTEGEVRATFNEQVELSNDCNDTLECAVVYAGCPLGCSAAVNVEKQEEIEELAKELITQYERNGIGCAYSCTQQFPVCVENKCVLDDQ
ncbi:hypothetical protein [Allohahella sp. A8]|uniref:hypothetical protein n=1 Tax=Allohahella sp. A8 TaxID=3141461 RepID=UPI003A7FC99E